jgi:hypothetical protein
MDFVIFLAGLVITVGTLLRLQKSIREEYKKPEYPNIFKELILNSRKTD